MECTGAAVFMTLGKKKVKQFDHSRLKKKNRNEDKLRWKGKWERPLNCDKSSLLIYVKYERRKEHALKRACT